MPIANFFIPRILKAIRDLNHYDEDDVDMIRYSLEAIFWEAEKLVYLAAIFIILGYGWHFLACFLAILTIRPNAGGFHSSTVWGCFFWTLLGFALATFALPLIPLHNVTVVLVAAFCLMVTFVASPLRSKQMERIAKKDKDQQKKITVTFVTLIWFVVLFIHQEHALAPAVLWIIFLQNIQLLIEWLKRKSETRLSLN